MTRVLSAVLLVVLQVATTFAPCFLVRCIHADGTEAVELVGSECCRIAHEIERADPPARDHPSGPVVRASGDDCRDAPVRPDEVPTSRVGVRSQSEHVERVTIAAVFVTTLTQPVIAAALSFRGVRGPPRDAVPRPPGRPFVLRC